MIQEAKTWLTFCVRLRQERLGVAIAKGGWSTYCTVEGAKENCDWRRWTGGLEQVRGRGSYLAISGSQGIPAQRSLPDDSRILGVLQYFVQTEGKGGR